MAAAMAAMLFFKYTHLLAAGNLHIPRFKDGCDLNDFNQNHCLHAAPVVMSDIRVPLSSMILSF